MVQPVLVHHNTYALLVAPIIPFLTHTLCKQHVVYMYSVQNGMLPVFVPHRLGFRVARSYISAKYIFSMVTTTSTYYIRYIVLAERNAARFRATTFRV